MDAQSHKTKRCAIYTRKSTEHGLDLAFNSLAAQREACQAFIKSQASEGWRALPDPYDDAAFSGGSLDRPGLQRLIAAITAHRVDVVVVYKIDRLTRSLTDFAKLIELFDANSCSFVAVTQQFNTTTSMGRLTLNVLLSFAQFERELASERVRDKVAASRRKGIWTGGGIPLGYDVVGKKLVVNPAEAETVRFIFQRYDELGCLRRLADDLRSRGIISKRRIGRRGQFVGGKPFDRSGLAYLLRNRTYLGEIRHKEAWYPAEHQPIVTRDMFDRVAARRQAVTVARRKERAENGALLIGRIFDDRGHRMTPTFTAKRAVRYPAYVSLAVLSGRKAEAGSLPRIAAPALERAVIAKLREHLGPAAEHTADPRNMLCSLVDRVVVARHEIRITLALSPASTSHPIPAPDASPPAVLVIPWQPPARRPFHSIALGDCGTTSSPNVELMQAVVRAHIWVNALLDGTHASIESLAAEVDLHPKFVRKAIRLAFLAPSVTARVLTGTMPLGLTASELRKVDSLSWQDHAAVVTPLALRST